MAVTCVAASQYDETHECADSQGRHGVAAQTPRFGLTMNALSASTWTSRRIAPAMNSRRDTGVAAAIAAVSVGLRLSHQVTAPPAQRAAAQPCPMRSTTPVNAVNPTTPASMAMVSQTTAVNERRLERCVSAISPTNVARGSARTGRGPWPQGERPGGGYTTQSVSTVPTITIDALLDRYDAILFDAYGVLVHGSGPLPGAAELLTRLNREDRPYFVVTNDASKLPATAASRYQRFGLPIDAEPHPHVRHAAERALRRRRPGRPALRGARAAGQHALRR